VRPSRCRALSPSAVPPSLCRALRPSTVQFLIAVRPLFVVFLSLCRGATFVVRRLTNLHGKAIAMHTSTPPGSTGARHVAYLPCVCTRQCDQMSFAVCIHTAKATLYCTRQRPRYIFCFFFVFHLFPAFQNLRLMRADNHPVGNPKRKV
jgi:hypothetical protein